MTHANVRPLREEPEAPKVYCRQCHFFLDLRHSYLRVRGSHAALACTHPHALVIAHTPLTTIRAWLSPEARNAHNDCGDFQPRRWWSAEANNPLMRLALLVLITIGPVFLGGRQWWGASVLSLGLWLGGYVSLRKTSHTLEGQTP